MLFWDDSIMESGNKEIKEWQDKRNFTVLIANDQMDNFRGQTGDRIR